MRRLLCNFGLFLFSWEVAVLQNHPRHKMKILVSEAVVFGASEVGPMMVVSEMGSVFLASQMVASLRKFWLMVSVSSPLTRTFE